MSNFSSSHLSPSEVEEQIQQLKEDHQKELYEQRMELEAEIENLKNKEAYLIGSISWRITLPLRLANGLVWYARQKFRIFIHGLKKNPRLRLSKLNDLKQAQRTYEKIDKQFEDIKPSNNAKTAILIHLYYMEAWPLLSSKIINLSGKLSFDLFITLPPSAADYVTTIHDDYPKAHIFEVPNRGRDVLPFMQVASKLEALGYEYLLKLHSKKSPHRKDGHVWFSDMLNQLLPENPKTLEALKNALQDKQCGVIGPGGQYTSLRINYDGNSFFLLRSIKIIYSKKQSRYVHSNRSKYGFFAGTMFWARLDAFSKIFEAGFKVTDFEHEARHIDGTLAHGLERVFCVAPELEGKNIYEINSGIHQIPYKTYNIPEWSDIHPKNKKTKRRRPLLS